MRSINKVTLRGTVYGNDPTIKEYEPGKWVARFSVVTMQTPTTPDYHSCVCWQNLAEEARRYKRGAPITLEGRLKHRNYTGKDGTVRSITEVVVERFVP